jgi:hypothetical protein
VQEECLRDIFITNVSTDNILYLLSRGQQAARKLRVEPACLKSNITKSLFFQKMLLKQDSVCLSRLNVCLTVIAAAP